MGGDIYFSHELSNSRGVMILFKKRVDYTLYSLNKDNQGRWIMLDLTSNNAHIIFTNVYAPNEDNPQFFSEISSI